MAKGKSLVAAAIALSLIGASAYRAQAQEKLVATYGEVQTVLAFKVDDAALQKFLIVVPTKMLPQPPSVRGAR
jgi:hypothetical protein